ncbi:TPA: putative phage abortive infection protein [Morganella morganii]
MLRKKNTDKAETNLDKKIGDKDKVNWLLRGTILIMFVSFGLYLFKFHSPLSNNHTKWGEFGSYFGGITGPLVSVMAFIGLLKSISLTKKQFEIQSQENTFFNLLNFHSSKVTKIYSEASGKTDAFKYLCEKYNEIYESRCITVALNGIVKNQQNLPEYLYHNFIKYFFTLDDHLTIEEIKSRFSQYLKNFDNEQLILNDINLKRRNIEDYGKYILIEVGRDLVRDMSADERVKVLKNAFNGFYDELGYVTGSYIRNIYYILSHSNESINGDKYAKIFRAQLSRYELVMIFLNMSSSYCKPDFTYLIKKFDILNGLYINDLCYNPTSEMYKDDLNSIYLHSDKM